MTPDLLRKLTADLDKSIATDVQVVYLLAGMRKLIERDKIEGQYRQSLRPFAYRFRSTTATLFTPLQAR
jgi:hypothetical protein